MSKMHGDKARFHRLRKQSIERRRRVRELRDKLALLPALAPAVVSDTVKTKPPVI